MAVGLPKPLRLLAESAEDFRILSGLLQDSLLVPQQLRWQKKLGRFSLPLNRFCWELAVGEREHSNLFFRVASELVVEGVVSARHKGFESILAAEETANAQESAAVSSSSSLANLLAVELAEGPCLRFTFSQGLELCLWGGQAEKVASPAPSLPAPPSLLRARLTDSREVQRTDKLPSHLS